MVNFFIYAKGFTANGKSFYHSNGLKTIEQFKNDIETIKQELLIAEDPPTESKVIYLHWGDICERVDEDTTRTAYLEEEGYYWPTCPKSIIDWLKTHYDICSENNKIRLLYIITDGRIDDDNVRACFESNENMYYETVVVHTFNEYPWGIDLSLALAFLKKRCMIYYNHKLKENIDISIEFDYDKINVNNFNSEKDNLKSYLQSKYRNKSKQDPCALREIDELKKLRARLFEELSSETHKNHNLVNLETKDQSVFLREFVRTDWYRNLVTNARETTVDIEKTIATLINYIVSETKSFFFNALKFDMKLNKTVEEKPIGYCKLTAKNSEAGNVIRVVTLTKFNLLNKIIFHENSPLPASFREFKSTMVCPLFLVNDKDISESIGYFYTLEDYLKFVVNAIKTEPRTQKPFRGGVVLIDTDRFDKYNDYILSATYFDCRKINFNIGLFYYVLWKNCENKEWMDRNVVTQFQNYAMRRISETVCKIGLSSLPLDPQFNTSLLTALWYCVELSSCIFKDDVQNFTQERLRMFHSVAHNMIEILKYFNYDIDFKSIERRRELISHIMILKRIQKRREKVYYLLERIFKTVEGFLVNEIENPFNLYMLNYLKLNHKEMLRDDVVEETVHLNDYVHLMHFVGDLETSAAGKSTYDICKKTFRPLFTVGQSKSFYTELVNMTKKVVISNDDDKEKVKVTYEPVKSLEFDRILSLYNLFITCVIDLEKYPTLPEYVDYISKKKKFHGDLVTIFPSNVYYDLTGVYAQYQKIVTNVEVSTFIKVCKTYVERFERIRAEEIINFGGEDEINNFISSEELKVHLKKKV